MDGWIIKPPGGSRIVQRPGQQPNFYIDMEPVFEMWIWDGVANLWYVMTTDEKRIGVPGVVPFHPMHTEEQLRALRDQWRTYRLAGGQWPIR